MLHTEVYKLTRVVVHVAKPRGNKKGMQMSPRPERTDSTVLFASQYTDGSLPALPVLRVHGKRGVADGLLRQLFRQRLRGMWRKRSLSFVAVMSSEDTPPYCTPMPCYLYQIYHYAMLVYALAPLSLLPIGPFRLFVHHFASQR